MFNKPRTTTTNTVQNTTRNPWAPTINPLTSIVGRASELSSNVGNFTPEYSNQTMAGIQGLTDLANQGPGGGFNALDNVVGGTTGAGFDTGLAQLQRTASGGMIGANQYLDPVVNRVMSDTADKVNSQFTAGGRYGSGAHTGTLAKELGNTAANMNLTNYNTERTAQDNAARTLYGGGLQGAGFSGQLDSAEMRPATLNLQAGNLQDQILNAQRTAPMNAVQWGSSIINPIAQQGGTSNSNGTQTQQTVQPTNWLTTGTGLAGMGLSMLNPATAMGGGFANLGGLLSGLGR